MKHGNPCWKIEFDELTATLNMLRALPQAKPQELHSAEVLLIPAMFPYSQANAWCFYPQASPVPDHTP